MGDLVDRTLPKETQEGNTGRGCEEANTKEYQVPTCHPGSLARSNSGETKHETRGSRCTARTSDQGCKRQSQVCENRKASCCSEKECGCRKETATEGFQQDAKIWWCRQSWWKEISCGRFNGRLFSTVNVLMNWNH